MECAARGKRKKRDGKQRENIYRGSEKAKPLTTKDHPFDSLTLAQDRLRNAKYPAVIAQTENRVVLDCAS
jgi:hypothetical protein